MSLQKPKKMFNDDSRLLQMTEKREKKFDLRVV